MTARTFPDWRTYTEVPPPASDDPVDHLRHTLASFTDEPDRAMALTATSNLYAPRLRTGLTWGDLRAILRQLESGGAG
jgi:hypothetical protein